MPIYEYKCQQCGRQIEVRQSVSDEPVTTCEKCHGKMEKQWSLSGFQFKGAGWYVTDYAKSGSEKSEKSSSSESTGSAETASKPKEETKSAVKESTTASPAKE